ncbi:MAG TPA: G1 family glutamic endopeptidase [Chloroflexota bacterium]|nr:G1 family glutamic endopeptidase [Chloroflexota bacterium]
MQLTNKLISILSAVVLGLGVVATPASAATGLYMASNNAPAQAIQAVIQQANQEQAQAFSTGNPSLMQDTATSDYYQQMSQTNQDMKNNGVTGIQLVNIAWGPVRLMNDGSARAVTDETWRTTFSDGTTDESTDRNVYTLVQQNGAWKIAADAHPDSEIQIPGPNPNPSGGSSGNSINWSGYSATGGNFTAVNGTWTIPQPSASGSGADAAWVGIGGVTSRDLIQAGTEETVQNGQIGYDAWIETLPQASHNIPLAVHAGDSVSVSISQTSPGQWQVTLKNNTTGQNYQQSIAYNSSLSSAEWVEEAPSARRGIVPLDDFGTINFTGATTVKNGQQENISQAGGQPITMINTAGQPLATTSQLGADGSSFSVTRTGNQATTAPSPHVVTVPIPIGIGGGSGFPGIPVTIGRGRGGFVRVYAS